MKWKDRLAEIFLISDPKLTEFSRTIYARMGEKRTVFIGIVGDLSMAVDITLECAEGASIECYIFALLTEKASVKIITRQIHASARAQSRLSSAQLMFGHAYCTIHSLIHIEKQAVGCQVHQHNHALLMGERCVLSTTPALEILTNDVECSHGSALGFADEAIISYATSRGCDVQTVQRIMCEGFVTAHIPAEILPLTPFFSLVHSAIS